jgi:hypothetical protein
MVHKKRTGVQVKLKRALLAHHLQRISCGGQIEEAVFTGAFATNAMSTDIQLLVMAPNLSETRALFKKDEQVGVAELPKLIKAVGTLAGAGNEAVDVEIKFTNHRLVVNEGERGLLNLVTAQPKAINTRVGDEILAKLKAKAPKSGAKGGVPLTRTFVEGVRNTFKLFSAQEIELFIGPKGGKVRVGNVESDNAEFAAAELKAAKDYTLLFGEHFVDVLGVITNYNDATLHLGGPDSFILIEDGGYQYMLTPHSRSADEA